MGKSFEYQLELAKGKIRDLQAAVYYYQREAARRNSEELNAQLELNQKLIEYILVLEEELDAIKQRNN